VDQAQGVSRFYDVGWWVQGVIFRSWEFLRVLGLGLMVECFAMDLKVWGFGLRVERFKFRDSGFEVWGLGCRVSGSVILDWGFEFRVSV